MKTSLGTAYGYIHNGGVHAEVALYFDATAETEPDHSDNYVLSIGVDNFGATCESQIPLHSIEFVQELRKALLSAEKMMIERDYKGWNE